MENRAVQQFHGFAVNRRNHGIAASDIREYCGQCLVKLMQGVLVFENDLVRGGAIASSDRVLGLSAGWFPLFVISVRDLRDYLE